MLDEPNAANQQDFSSSHSYPITPTISTIQGAYTTQKSLFLTHLVLQQNIYLAHAPSSLLKHHHQKNSNPSYSTKASPQSSLLQI